MGDVILTTPRTLGPIDRFFADNIEDTQRRHCDLQHCKWGHASLYLGDLLVAESNKSWPSQVKVTPLTQWMGCEFKILRYRGPAFVDNASDIVRQAYREQILQSRRRYPVRRALMARFGMWTPPDEEKGLLCSEFVLEQLARGGFMIDEYVDSSQPGNFYFPAHFAAEPKFDQLAMQYLQLTEIPSPIRLRKT